MKYYLRNINRGLVLSVVIVLGVIVYLIATALVQARERPVIEAFCREYVAAEAAFIVLPESYRFPHSSMPDESFDAHIQSMETVLMPFYIDHERIREIALERLTNQLASQREGQMVLQTYEKTILSFDTFVFDGTRVRVEFTTQSVIEYLEHDVDGIQENRIADEVSDHVVLEKSEGQWRVVYASLNQPYRSVRY